ncbi:aminotransferase class IV [Streptoalloteichus hindustanus]|uniref:Branched-chain amino acid aminotransferase/4-amino-4-deoxychorismate lyase n=1 Tax=Streptoalloteichus hindustanus TaxID=2017 RepID=A0A1M5NDZ6_STRHI|nr:aminotransferase class IV [Streptoalloteichus hindustanus]SHG87685.1 Branched-chain amino acid aminotransferase/4-amino-4-deoxychorismate lyase [Streptoalloteichus hindustanus]
MDVGLFRWEPGRGLASVRPDAPRRLLVADSWLVEDGRVRGLDLHERRFAAGCAEVGGTAGGELAAFWAAALARLPRRGAWFPRVELDAADAGPRLQVRVRPAPRRGEVVRVWAAGPADRRRAPRRKGPDLGWLTALRGEAAGVGADEVLLTTGAGLLRETATASLLWWDGAALCVPDPALRVLPGVTAALVRREAEARGIAVRRRRCTLSALAGREVWLVNALHGIRPVVE